MKWQWSVTNLKPSKLLQVIMVLAAVKICFMLTMFNQDEHGQGQTKPVFVEAGLALAAEENAESEVRDAPADIGEELQKLRKREEELDRRERNLSMLEQEIDQKLADLTRLENRLEKMLEEADVLKDQKIRHLVDVYANMNARQAAEVLETLDESIAVKILAGMRGRQAGEILTNVDSRKAARLSELLTELHAPFID